QLVLCSVEKTGCSEFNELMSLTKNTKALESDYDPNLGILYIYQNSLPRFSYSPDFLQECLRWQADLCEWLKANPYNKRKLRYIVGGSVMPQVFNLGGDLQHFVKLIGEGDKDSLREYAHLCIDVLWKWVDSYHDSHITTLCLVQGAALGGGFEGALSADYTICEENVKMGLPEIHFNLFPGMGAFQLLSQRIGPKFAEKFILEGKIHRSQNLFEQGIVDVVVPKGKGMRAVEDFVRKDREKLNGNQAIRNIKRQACPISYEGLIEVTDTWVERAFDLREEDIQVMKNLIDLQQQKYEDNKYKIHLGAELKKMSIKAKKPIRLVQSQLA
ncbi:MAG: crotonase/enoyl-CoA hydratase family protein, partial [Pseudomonadota bacterium]